MNIVFAQPSATEISVRACKYDLSVHRTWHCRLVEETNELWTFVGVFREEVRHPLLGVIEPGTVSLEFYWKREWYNVFRFYYPNGALRNYYCNVNMPPTLTEDVLTYVDLDVDVLVQPDLSYQVLDIDEFRENSVLHRYPTRVIEKTNESVNSIIALIERRAFPFDSVVDARLPPELAAFL